MQDYQGRKAVIVGGTTGMGLATVRMLVDGGAEVLLTGRNEANIAAVAEEFGSRAYVVRAHVARMADIDALAAEVEAQLGQVDLVFVNAGIGIFESFAAVTEATYDRFFAVNAKGAFFAAQPRQRSGQPCPAKLPPPRRRIASGRRLPNPATSWSDAQEAGLRADLSRLGGTGRKAA